MEELQVLVDSDKPRMRGFSGCMRKLTCHEKEGGRPSCYVFNTIIFMQTIIFFFLGFGGFFALPTYLSGNAAQATIVGYNTFAGECIWVTYPIISYSVNNIIYSQRHPRGLGVCGDYESTSLYRAEQFYPLQTNISVWYSMQNPTELYDDPRSLVKALGVCSIFMGIGVIWFVVHLMLVWFCGIETCCCRPKYTYRFHDPY